MAMWSTGLTSFPSFLLLKKKKKNPPSPSRCYFSCCCLPCDWSFIQHSPLLPIFSAELALTQPLWANSLFSGDLQSSHWGKHCSVIVLQSLLNIHSTNRTVCSSSFVSLLTPKAWTSFASSFQIPAADDLTHLPSSVKIVQVKDICPVF